MGWEWRYWIAPEQDWTPVHPKDGGGAEEVREDIYFPCGADVGLKLRAGAGGLEVKLRTKAIQLAGRGCAEKWKKAVLGSAVVTRIGNGAFIKAGEHARIACAFGAEHESALSEALQCNQQRFAGLRVHCRKRRRFTALGERTHCTLIAHKQLRGASGREGGSGACVGSTGPPPVEEAWETVCVERQRTLEGGAKQGVARAVAGAAFPAGAVVGGYPAIVT
eukprot:g8158.t1